MPPERDDKKKAIVRSYFDAIADIRAGDRSGLDRLVSLWTPEGVQRVTGAPGAPGWPKEYHGTQAIRARYEAMMSLEGQGIELGRARERVRFGVTVALDEIEAAGDTATAIVTATVNTNEKPRRGFEVPKKKFAFSFKDDRIASVVEDVDWSRSEQPKITGIRLSDLSVADIGRLTLAAWAIA